MNGYESFAAFYDALTDDVDYTAWADYLLAVFSRFGGKSGQLLDLACGSGSLSLALADRGVDVIGIDNSADMLSLAREKAMEQSKDVMFLCQDLRQMDLYGTAEGAVCLLDGLNHILETSQLAEVFRRLGLFIEPGGLVVFDANTPYKHRTVLANNDFVFERDDFLCTWRNRFVSEKNETRMQLDFFAEAEDGTYVRESDEVRERAYSLATWKRLLADAGFDFLAVYGALTFEEPAPEEQRWVLVARNRGIAQKNGA